MPCVLVFPQVLWTTWWWPICRAETCSCSYLMMCFDWVYIYIYIYIYTLFFVLLPYTTGMTHLKTDQYTPKSRNYVTRLSTVRNQTLCFLLQRTPLYGALRIFLTDFQKVLKYQISLFPSSGSRVGPCGRTGRRTFYISLTVHHIMILGKWPTWRTIPFYILIFIFNSQHVSSTSCSSSGETNCVNGNFQ
jgi:hypothetical protein